MSLSPLQGEGSVVEYTQVQSHLENGLDNSAAVASVQYAFRTLKASAGTRRHPLLATWVGRFGSFFPQLGDMLA